METIHTESAPNPKSKHNCHGIGINGTDNQPQMHGVGPISDSKPLGSYPPTGIDVLVVGTGLAGLTAAIECVRKGHKVKVLERNATINTAGNYLSCCILGKQLTHTGDMYFMGLSATRFFKHWPEMATEYEVISLHDAWIETFKHSGEQVIKPLKVADRLRAQGLDPKTPPGTFQMRPLVYKMFVRQLEKLGVGVEYNCRVVDYQEDEKTAKAVAITDGGKKYEADVIIAADGVGSKSQSLVGGQVRAVSSGRAMWRAAFPRENIEKSSNLEEFFRMVGPDNSEPIVRTFLGYVDQKHSEYMMLDC
jgi:2-polyprenyl-6-methoxyphenol hydroxylase-like FAD-dependent oxidoreductase